MRTTFLKKGLRELWAHKLQYLLLILVLGLGVGMYASFNDFANIRWQSMEGSYDAAEFMDTQAKVQYGEYINLTTLDEVLAHENITDLIESYEVRFTYDIFINHTVDGEIKTTKGLVQGYEWFEGGAYTEQTVNRPLFYVDDPETISSSDARECYSERKFSLHYDLGSDDQIQLIKGSQKMDITIREQAAIPEYMYVVLEGQLMPAERSLGILMLPMDTALELYFGQSDSEPVTNDIVFLLKDRKDVEGFNENISALLQQRGIPVQTIEKEENTAHFLLYTDYQNDKDNMAIYPIIIFGVSGFGLVMALRRMIKNHRPQIGIFKALGVPNRSVLIYFGVIGVVIAALGTVAGVLIAILLNVGWRAMLTTMLGFPVEELGTSPEFYLIGGLISLVLCLSCTLIPAAFAMRIKPIDAIQKREGISKKKVGRFGVLMRSMRWLPVSFKLSIRNLLRKPGRSTTTILGVAASFALFLAFMMAMDSVMIIFDSAAEGSNWDYEVMLEGFSPENATADWEVRYEEIDTINQGLVIPIELGKTDDPDLGILYGVKDLLGAFNFDIESGGIQPGGVLISSLHSNKYDLGVGDHIEISVPYMDPELGYQTRLIELEVTGVQTNHLGNIMFTDLDTLRERTNLLNLTNVVYIDTIDDDPVRSLENGLITTPGISSVTHLDERKGLLEEYMALFVSIIYIMALISSLLAGAIIYTMFKISAQERERDYATMKTLGTSIGKITKLLSFEAAYITFWGIAIGVLGAFGMAELMFANAAEFEEFNLEIIFSWSGFFIGSMIIIGVVIIVSFLTIRYIKKINIANVIRERSTG